MNKRGYLLISVVTFFIGVFFFAYNKEWIIFNFPKNDNSSYLKSESKKIVKKNISLFYWHNSKWNGEDIEIIWSNLKNENCFIVVSAWLNLLDEEKVVDKKISLQSAISGIDDKEVFLSFDRSFLNEESSTFDKLMVIEGLLKTLRENDVDIQKVYFLIHHQEMKDVHLNFAQSWSINGFIK